MYYKISDFVTDFDLEIAATLKVFNNLTDKSLGQKVTEKGRSLGRLAWHLANTFGEMGSAAGLQVYSIDEKSIPSSAKIILDEYSKSASSLKNAVLKAWNDNSLNDEINMYGQTWTKSQVLSALLVHQMHHRGQMTVLMRQAGLKVPGVYGPAYEEWESMGMPPQE
jgi:uncharacterized damage-inducible protein DinB